MVISDIREALRGQTAVGTGDASQLVNALTSYLTCRAEALATARKQLGINELDAKAIAFVAENPGARPSQLRLHLNVTAAGVTTLAERLVQRGIFRREFDQADRRVNHIYLVVDLATEPWSQLTQFDADCADAVSRLDPRTEAEFAAFLEKALAGARTRD